LVDPRLAAFRTSPITSRDQIFEIAPEPAFDRNTQPIELVPHDITRILLNLIGNGFYFMLLAPSDGRRVTRPATVLR
jgi:hypothetical protein